MISSISCLLIVCFLEKAMLDDVIRLQFNTVETIWRPTTTRPSTSVWKMILTKILPKYVGRKDLFFFLFVKETRTAGRESGQHKTLLTTIFLSL
jgi:hypothetical protein